MSNQLTERMEQLKELDMRFDGQSFLGSSRINKDFNLPHYDLQFSKDFEWDKTIREFTNELQRRKDKTEFQTLDAVEQAFFNGETVYWDNDNYCIDDFGVTKGERDNLVVKCITNNHAISLFYADNVSSDHKPEDFYTEINNNKHLTRRIKRITR